MNFINIKTIILVIAVIVFFQFFHEEEFSEGDATLSPETKILAFGDSITHGYNLPSTDSYPSQLANLLHVEVINAGVNGEISSDGLKRLPIVLDKYQPNILILCHGGNDILRKLNLIETKRNISTMVELAKAKNIYVLLVGVPKFDILNFQTEPLYYEIASEQNIPLEDNALEKILEDNNLKIDNVHPNQKGYAIMAKKIAKIISETYFPSYSY